MNPGKMPDKCLSERIAGAQESSLPEGCSVILFNRGLGLPNAGSFNVFHARIEGNTDLSLINMTIFSLRDRDW